MILYLDIYELFWYTYSSNILLSFTIHYIGSCDIFIHRQTNSIGIHPWTLTEKNAQEQWNSLQQAVMDKRIIAIGEAGIDKIKGPSLKIQTNIFKQEIILSETMGLPLIIHCVRASNEIIQLKKKILFYYLFCSFTIFRLFTIIWYWSYLFSTRPVTLMIFLLDILLYCL